MMEEGHYATFWEHLDQLRDTLIRCLVIVILGMVTCFSFSHSLIALLTAPLSEMPEKSLILLSPLEGITCALKISFVMGMVLTAPLWGIQIFGFIAPAFNRSLRRWIAPFFVLSFVMVALGSYMTHQWVLPLANTYLWEFNQPLGQNLWSLSSYLHFTLLLMIANAVAFESFVIVLFLIHFGIFSNQKLREKRRHAIVFSFVIGAFLTPPDVLTQCFLAILLIFFYEAAIFYAKVREFLGNKKSPNAESV